MGNTRSKWRASQLAFYDGTTYETTLPLAPRYLFDDFEGETLNTNIWLANDLNLATQTVHDGYLDLLLTNESNPQEADCGASGNSLDWDISKGLVVEYRANLVVLPDGESEIHLGVLGETIVDQQQISSADDVAEHAVFSFDGSGLCKINTDDGTNQTTAVTTGITVTAGAYHVYRIDFTDTTNVLFYIDGVQVIPATTVAMDDIASPLVQPAMIAQKNANTGVGNLAVDYIKIWQATR
jgi:hypothetical protein